jgi:hypothetical protein
MKKTCDGPHEKQSPVDENECKKLCHENTECNFFFFVQSVCIMYQSCYVTRIPGHDGGITYAKDACPTGIMFPIYIVSSISQIYIMIYLICSC